MEAPLTETTLKTLLEEQTDLILRTVKDGFDGVDEQFDAVDQRFDAVDQRFDAVDQRFAAIEGDLAHLKQRIAAIEDEVRTLSANILTKQDLDRKFDELLLVQRKDALFKQKLILILTQAKLLNPDARRELEQLIPS